MPTPRFCPPITFFPTAATSSSCPVLTGHLSVPGLVTNLTMGTGSMAIIGFWPADMQAFLIAAASVGATIERVFTSVMGPSPTGVTTTLSPPPDEELLPPPSPPLDEELLPSPPAEELLLLPPPVPPDPGISDARP